jgi:hypothetical protein
MARVVLTGGGPVYWSQGRLSRRGRTQSDVHLDFHWLKYGDSIGSERRGEIGGKEKRGRGLFSNPSERLGMGGMCLRFVRF